MQTRRRFLQGLVGWTALATSARVTSAFQATEINHITMNVAELKRSEEFYSKLFGHPKWWSPQGDQPSALAGFEIGRSLLVLEAYPEKRRRVDHVCLSVKGYTLQSATEKVKQRGIEIAYEEEYGAPLFHFRDPDRILIQLYPPGYRNRAIWQPYRSPRSVAKPVFKSAAIDHITLQVTNVEKSTAFYEGLFGPADHEPNGTTLYLPSGQELACIDYGVGPVGIDHFCISIEDYEPDTVADRLRQNGIASERLYQPDQIFFRDPDGILVQLAQKDRARSRRRPAAK
jgi:catechol 2,3-dioxygenase-like lactoylglutathione lyase family enzyme